MLVSAKDMLNKAKAGKYAVGQFNINNLEWTKSILLAAQECNSPVILGVSAGAGKYMTGFKTVSAMVQNVFTITGYSGTDPEVPNGMDNSFYPRPRTYSVSLGLQF